MSLNTTLMLACNENCFVSLIKNKIQNLIVKANKLEKQGQK